MIPVIQRAGFGCGRKGTAGSVDMRGFVTADYGGGTNVDGAMPAPDRKPWCPYRARVQVLIPFALVEETIA